ncbi:hypothetical protein AWC29_27870 [Mycobacterium triplex]|uniref:Uncharacterized protein n=1 Tax=Mycobacterium triplex TaxID=47839 RepID=A0A024JVL3_9MYCO|nr:hypothetical protein [Mycobacterium triplex]ORW99560.1 hypothetical protein AWC29_27870 [Mycobacterium triplex]CDO87624.1 hypothetical protein BN973_01979 [Mycobacterium triplex]
MGSLTPADVKRWDLNAIHAVFETATGRANTLQRLGESLQQAHNVLAEWQGEAGDAFRVDIGKIRRDIEADGAESQQVAAAVSRAEADIAACKHELDTIEGAAQASGWTVTPDWRIDLGPGGIPANRLDLATKLQNLQAELNACKAHAHTADHELATAIGAAVGAVPLDAAESAPAGAPAPQGPPAPAGKPKTWQEMLTPPGAAAAPGGTPPRAPSAPAQGGKPRSLQDMLLPGGPVPLPAPSPAEMESAKSLLRKVMAGDGVPPDQIEARVNEVVAGAQRWIDQGGIPPYLPPEPKPLPAPGFGEGFADRWFATEESVHNLLGVGNRGLPGALDAWKQMIQGTVETVQNPAGAAIGEVQNAMNSPSAAYYLGGKASDAAVSLPAMLFGPEVAGVGRLADIDAAAAIDYGPTHLPHTPVGFEHPIPFHPFADQAGQDLFAAYAHREPTADLSRILADMSTHYVGDDPDRVVLGKFGGLEGGYIGEARGQGGIYFSTGDPAWDAITYGLSRAEEHSLVWPVNEQFLRNQMERAIPRIEYHLPQGVSSVEELMTLDPYSYSAKEIAFLKSNAEMYGYRQVGDSWILIAGDRG